MKSEEKQVRVQLLEEGEFHEGQLFKLKQGQELRLQLSNKLMGHRVRLFSNLPPDNKTVFERSRFYEYEWRTLSGGCLPNDDFAKFVSLECNKAGAFSYFFTLNGKEGRESSSGGSNFLVDPQLRNSDGHLIDLESLQVQTVLTKLLGPLDEWQARIEVAKNTGYNMIHFRYRFNFILKGL